MHKPKRSRRAPTRGWVLTWRIALCAWFLLALWPVNSTMVRLAQVIALILIWPGAILVWWHRRALRYGLILSLIVAVTIVSLPGRAVSPERLLVRYVSELGRFENSPYIWGGESRLGIDCSGLVRCGLINALWKEGVGSGNPWCVRRALSYWWHDASARALAAEYRGETIRMFPSSSINDLPEDKLRPGDLAVTADGVHVLAHLGGGEWIEADPAQHKVIRLRASSSNPWLKVPVNVVRWQLLSPATN